MELSALRFLILESEVLGFYFLSCWGFVGVVFVCFLTGSPNALTEALEQLAGGICSWYRHIYKINLLKHGIVGFGCLSLVLSIF